MGVNPDLHVGRIGGLVARLRPFFLYADGFLSGQHLSRRRKLGKAAMVRVMLECGGVSFWVIATYMRPSFSLQI